MGVFLGFFEAFALNSLVTFIVCNRTGWIGRLDLAKALKWNTYIHAVRPNTKLPKRCVLVEHGVTFVSKSLATHM